MCRSWLTLSLVPDRDKTAAKRQAQSPAHPMLSISMRNFNSVQFTPFAETCATVETLMARGWRQTWECQVGYD